MEQVKMHVPAVQEAIEKMYTLPKSCSTETQPISKPKKNSLSPGAVGRLSCGRRSVFVRVGDGTAGDEGDSVVVLAQTGEVHMNEEVVEVVVGAGDSGDGRGEGFAEAHGWVGGGGADTAMLSPTPTSAGTGPPEDRP